VTAPTPPPDPAWPNNAEPEPSPSSAAIPVVPPRPIAISFSAAPLPALPFWLPPLFYLALATLFLWRSTFTGQVFLPAGLLGQVAPWTAHFPGGSLPSWDPLRWDGIAQFYPWRHFAARTLRAGTIPLWNPYQFCGTPFVANSQSAVLYPGNLGFYLLPTAQAFGVSALLHLTLCGWFTYLLLRRLRCGSAAALLGGAVYAYSAWQVAWLQLPTFLATSCWFPLLLARAYTVLGTPTPSGLRLARSAAGLGAVVGLMLLAGHLQIAFYGLLAGSLWALCLLAAGGRAHGWLAAARGLAACIGGLALGFLLAAPQLLPTLELSRMSHRAGTPTAAGYRAYIEYALPPAGLAMLTLPEFFGNNYDPNNPYWGYYIKVGPDGSVAAVRHNPAETAAYVGIVPLLLGILALLRGVRAFRTTAEREAEPESRLRSGGALFFGGLAVAALLLALGTPLNALFYFGVPGFGQSGSPARSLVLWALAWAALSGLGLHTLLDRPPSRHEIGIVLGAFALILILGLGLAAISLAVPPPNLTVPTLGDVFERIGAGWIRLAAAVAAGAAILLPALRGTSGQGNAETGTEGRGGAWRRVPALVPAALLAVVADLFLVGLNVNPTAPPAAVYPETPGLQLLRQRVGPHERIFPINQQWSLYKPPPAVLPPNAAMVYGLRDVQGYDSLFPGQYKAFANQFARPNRQGVLDASPPEVGNMVFFQNATAPLTPYTAAALAVTLPLTSEAFAPQAVPSATPLYDAAREMALFALPNSRPRAWLQALAAPAASPAARLTWRDDGPTRVALDVDTTVPATLNLADQFYPGWRATIDGSPAVIMRQAAAPIYRAVAVPPGRHRIAFRYDPASFRVGLYLACLACLLIALLLASGLSERKTGIIGHLGAG